MDALAVEHHLDPVDVFEPADLAERRLHELDLEHVLAVARKRVRGHEAADRAQRQAIAMLALRHVRRGAEDARRRIGVRIPQRQRGHDAGRAEVALEQGRRHAEDVGVVVESVARIVGRQQHRGIDLERQQVADGVGVLGAVQPVQRRPAGIGHRHGCRVERRFQIGDERGRCRLRRPRHPGGRHQAAAQLQDDLLPGLGVRRRTGQVEPLEHQPAGLRALTVAAEAGLADDAVVRGDIPRRRGSRRSRLTRRARCALRRAPGRKCQEPHDDATAQEPCSHFRPSLSAAPTPASRSRSRPWTRAWRPRPVP